MKCTEYQTLNPVEKMLAKWYYREEGPCRFVVDTYDILIWTENKNFSHSDIYLKCLDCMGRKRIGKSQYTASALKDIKKNQEVFTDGGATFKG